MKYEQIEVENFEQYNRFLIKIENLIEQGKTNIVYKEYAELIIKIEKQESFVEKQLKGNIFASFAYFLFSIHEYEEFFKMLKKSQHYGYSKDEIESVLWQAFINPNVEDFKKIYDTNMGFLVSNNYIYSECLPEFEDLTYWLLPSGEEKGFYLYDKTQKEILEKIMLYDFESIELEAGAKEFSDYLIIENGSWNNFLSFHDPISKMGKKTYVIFENIMKFLSCMQGAILSKEILSNVIIFDSYGSMDDYFKQNNAYLPRNIYNFVDNSNKAQDYINTIHNYRLHKENRKGNNIILSICIPSYNRGDRAYENIIRLLNSKYDEEIEFIVSNNGTQNNTKKYYNKIKRLPDSRIKYFAFEVEQGFANNMCKVCELANGKYLLLLSDEDIIDFVVLDKVMNKLIKSSSNLSLMRTSSNTQSSPPAKFAGSMEDALLTFMLSSNYISGIIYNTALLKQSEGIEYVRENLENQICLHYPHMYWELRLCEYGNVLGTDLQLIKEGLPEKMEEEYVEIINNDFRIPIYAKFRNRLKQHEDFVSVFKTMKVCKENPELYKKMYISLCYKTLHLVNLSINLFYNKMDIDTVKLFNEACDFCLKKEFTDIFFTNYENDLIVLNEVFDHFKNQLV